MNARRVKAIVLHAWYHLNHSMETWIDLFWFSIINVLVFGLIVAYLAEGGNTQQVEYLLLGLILWSVIYTGQYSVTVGALWEIWSKSFSSLFISPLTMDEFVVGQMVGGLFKALAVFIATAITSIVLYNFSIFNLGWVLSLLLLELMIFSWSSGIFILGLILRFGTTIQSLAWGLIFLIQPLGAVFFPVEVLPTAIRWVSYLLPSTYIFEIARAKYTSGVVDWNFLLIGTLLNIFFFIASFWFMRAMLERGKRTGSFARMES